MYAFVKVMGATGRAVEQFCEDQGIPPGEFLSKMIETWAKEEKLPAPPAEEKGQGLEVFVRTYTKMRDTCATINKLATAEVDGIKQQMNSIQGHLLGKLNAEGVKSMNTAAGTFYKEEEVTPSCADWGAFYNWIKAEDAFEFLERRVTKSAVVAYAKEHGELPPGISALREYVVRVRKSKDS